MKRLNIIIVIAEPRITKPLPCGYALIARKKKAKDLMDVTCGS